MSGFPQISFNTLFGCHFFQKYWLAQLIVSRILQLRIYEFFQEIGELVTCFDFRAKAFNKTTSLQNLISLLIFCFHSINFESKKYPCIFVDFFKLNNFRWYIKLTHFLTLMNCNMASEYGHKVLNGEFKQFGYVPIPLWIESFGNCQHRNFWNQDKGAVKGKALF